MQKTMHSIPGVGRSPGEGNTNPLQYSCLENSMDRGAWWATVHGDHSQTQLSDSGRWVSMRSHSVKGKTLVNCSGRLCHLVFCVPI